MRYTAFAIRLLRLDRLGIALSGLCALHCLLSIVLVAVLGLGGEWLLAPEIHRYGLAMAIIIAALTLGVSAFQHRKGGPLLIGFVGIAHMTAGLLVEHGPAEAILTVPGVLLVAFAHLQNLRLAV